MPETTALDIIQDALEKIQAYGPGDTVGDADAQRALNVLNNMLDSWSTEALTVFAYQEQSTVLTVGKIQYTIGQSGSPDLNLPRPIRLLSGPGSAYVLDTMGNRYDVEVLTQDQWNRIWNITNTNSSWPTSLFYDPQFPLGILNVYPSPNQGGMTLFWDSYLALTQFATLYTAFSFPPGYKLALVDTLARRLWRYFKKTSEQIPNDIVSDAAGAKRNIKRVNNREVELGFDPALYVRGQGYNVYSDATARR
jgi:hypothetical protein